MKPKNSYQAALQRSLRIASLGLALPALTQELPTIQRQPRSAARSVGDRLTINVAANGVDSPATFQWARSGTLLLNATNSSLTLTNLTVADAGSYRVVVANGAGSITSDPAELEVDSTFTFVTDTPFTKIGSWGLAWGDYDDDGLVDLVATGDTANVLFHNEQGQQFTKVVGQKSIPYYTYISGNVYGPKWLDFNNDGKLDFYTPTGGNWVDEPDILLRGDGAGGFVSVVNSFTRQNIASPDAAWGDFNGDGWLDVFLANLGPATAPRPNELWLGHPDGVFTKVAATNFPGLNRRNWGVSAADVDLDGDLDLVVGSNPVGSVILYNNLGNGKFDTVILATAEYFIGGPAFGDYDNDGLPDMFVGYVTDRSRLLHNDGKGQFTVVTDQPIAEESGRSLMAAWGDYDNDGWLDLFLPRTANWASEGGENDSLWRNNGDDTFTRIIAGSLGTDDIDSYAAAWADYNNDGFLDLAIACFGSSNRLFRNGGNTNHWLNLKLVGTKSNRDAIGARVHLRAAIGDAGDRRRNQYRQVGTGAGLGGQNDIRVHFGLAHATRADEIIIDWPSGQQQILKDIPAAQFLTITEPDDRIRLAIRPRAGSQPAIFEITISGPAAGQALVETSNDLRTWSAPATYPLDAQGKAILPAPSSNSGVTFFRARKP